MKSVKLLIRARVFPDNHSASLNSALPSFFADIGFVPWEVKPDGLGDSYGRTVRISLTKDTFNEKS